VWENTLCNMNTEKWCTGSIFGHRLMLSCPMVIISNAGSHLFKIFLPVVSTASSHLFKMFLPVASVVISSTPTTNILRSVYHILCYVIIHDQQSITYSTFMSHPDHLVLWPLLWSGSADK
jgi:hypothetical protein